MIRTEVFEHLPCNCLLQTAGLAFCGGKVTFSFCFINGSQLTATLVHNRNINITSKKPRYWRMSNTLIIRSDWFITAASWFHNILTCHPVKLGQFKTISCPLTRPTSVHYSKYVRLSQRDTTSICFDIFCCDVSFNLKAFHEVVLYPCLYYISRCKFTVM